MLWTMKHLLWSKILSLILEVSLNVTVWLTTAEIPYSFLFPGMVKMKKKVFNQMWKVFLNNFQSYVFSNLSSTTVKGAWQQESLLVREGQEDMLFCAGSTGHVLLLVVKFVVTGLSAADQFGQRVVLKAKYIK